MLNYQRGNFWVTNQLIHHTSHRLFLKAPTTWKGIEGPPSLYLWLLVYVSYDDAALRFSGHQICCCKGMIKICKMYGFSSVLLFSLKSICVCIQSSGADIFLKCPFWQRRRWVKSVVWNLRASKKCWKSYQIYHSVQPPSFQMCSKIVVNDSHSQDTYGIPCKYHWKWAKLLRPPKSKSLPV